MEFDRSKKIKNHLDISPLIDIVFLLLIFFILTSNFIMQPGIKITLPTAKSARPQEKQKIIVFISENNDLFLNEKDVSISALEGVLESELKEAGSKIVVLKADGNINLGLAIRVMDIAKEAGAEDVIIATEISSEDADVDVVQEK